MNPRARSWCFTINNPSETDKSEIEKCNGEYLYQEECGENGTNHYQGVIKFKNAISFKSMKKKLTRAHLEVTKNLKASVKYCSKKETRIGDIICNSEKLKKMTQVTQENSKNFKCILKSGYPCVDCRKKIVKSWMEDFDSEKIGKKIKKILNED